MLSGRQEGKSIINGLDDLIKERLPADLSSIAIALTRIAGDLSIQQEAPEINEPLRVFIEGLRGNVTTPIEDVLLSLYVTLHNARSFYSEEERKVLRLKGGYLCYPGGISPILLARNFIKGDTILADLGAGNGLQGLLLQYLYPHRKTIQIEISREMIRTGKLYQKALGIEEEKVEWINDDIMNASFEDADLIYIYRPARPVEGAALYRNIAERLTGLDKEITIFSVADCLAPLLGDDFTTFYDDGHLKIIVNYAVSSSVSHSQSGGLPFPW